MSDLAAISFEIYKAWREPREGRKNPTRMDNPLWAALVKQRINAYQVRTRLDPEGRLPWTKVWCFDRFGQSTTVLPDGRTVYIAGEHEDGTDDDFYIFNDVVIVEPGGQVAIYGYSHKVFPPTDSHSATLVGNQIWIIGSIGYLGQRRWGTTQVCRLDLATMAITKLTTAGEQPGWIARHDAAPRDGEIVISGGAIGVAGGAFIKNADKWALDLATLTWARRPPGRWQRWTLRRRDGEMSGLRELEQLQTWLEQGETRLAAETRAAMVQDRGREPDLARYRARYGYGGAVRLPRRIGDPIGVVRVALDGEIVHITEAWDLVEMAVQGELAADRLAGFQRYVVDQLNALDDTDAWRVA